MEIVVNSSTKMRDVWHNLVLGEKNDQPVRIITGDFKDVYAPLRAGAYYIENQMNRSGSLVSYVEVSDLQAKALMALDIEDAYEKMGKLIAP